MGVLAVLVPQQPRAQGLPDIVWEAIDGHVVSAEGVAYAPDGTYVAPGAGGTSDSVVRLWRASDGAPLESFSVYPHSVESVDIAPHKPLVAVGHIVSGYPPGGVAAVWNTDPTEELYTAGGYNIEFSPDGSLLASGGGGVNRYLTITQVMDGTLRHSLYTGSYLLGVAYSPAGLHRAGWDRRSGTGERVASGVYFARLTVSEESRTRKLVVVE
jgi:WD40 repeat protein